MRERDDNEHDDVCCCASFSLIYVFVVCSCLCICDIHHGHVIIIIVIVIVIVFMSEYLAPEFIFNLGHDASSDLWALGVVIHEMTMACTPFTPKRQGDMTELFTNIATVKVCMSVCVCVCLSVYVYMSV